MSTKAAITVRRSREELQRLWADPTHAPEFITSTDPTVSFKDAPGDRGSEIHVELEKGGGLLGGGRLAKVKDDLRRFKQHVETGEIPRSDATPEGERFERKFKQRPVQPLEESELEKAGVR